MFRNVWRNAFTYLGITFCNDRVGILEIKELNDYLIFD